MVKIIYWNVQGALDLGFNCPFKLLIKKRRLDIFAIMEPYISGFEADNIIRRSGFDSSYRVEAQGFSGRIWILSRDTMRVNVLVFSNQYVHVHCAMSDGGGSFFVSFVYASLDAMKQCYLWEQLMALDPGSRFPWVVGGDMNVIGSISERRSGSQH
ncbi:hypothetical protein HRI_002658600 [Hibiscus trionum]|uniref:Endonuclease/exonuclease/phosphatase domain-containing protein n=1 Tax=Hibiscus trionum TaxID=183268 RepID=A0A9W7I6L4_HIBTR|nr:hypothetical protein HRI_002658600 [Hibiscus trionum]